MIYLSYNPNYRTYAINNHGYNSKILLFTLRLSHKKE